MGRIYAQLYSLIRQAREGTLAALKTVSELGYDGVELLSTHTEGLSPTAFKAYLAELGLDAISSAGYATEEDLEFGRELGVRYCTFGRVSIGSTRDEVLRAAEAFNENGRIVARHGLRMIVHNHANEFLRVDGAPDGLYIHELLVRHTDPVLVGFELDVGWAQLAGVDCPAYLRKYPGRFPVVHVKECDRIARTEEEFEHFPPKIIALAKQLDPDFAKPGQPPRFPAEAANLMYESRSWNVALGDGLIDWKAMAAADVGRTVEAWISEREYYHIRGNEAGDPAKAAALDCRFMRDVLG